MASVVKKIVVNAPVSNVFQLWKNFENFPRFMQHVENIESIGPDETRWTLKGPLGTDVIWDAKTTYIEENKKIAWLTTGGQIETHGAVVFDELGFNQTAITVGLEYSVATGALGEAAVRLFDNPEVWLQEDLERFKLVAEVNDPAQAVETFP